MLYSTGATLVTSGMGTDTIDCMPKIFGNLNITSTTCGFATGYGLVLGGRDSTSVTDTHQRYKADLYVDTYIGTVTQQSNLDLGGHYMYMYYGTYDMNDYDIIDCDYLSIEHSVVTPSGAWHAGNNSTDNQATSTPGSGWSFYPETAGNVDTSDNIEITTDVNIKYLLTISGITSITGISTVS